MNIFTKYFSHIVFAAALAYFATLAFVMDKDPMTNKMLMVIVAGLWVLWIFAKSLLKTAAVIAIIGAVTLAGYYVIHAKEIECKNAGRVWNKKLEICEDKKTISEKIKGAMSDMFKTTFKKWAEDNIKIEKVEEDKQSTKDSGTKEETE